MDIGIIGVGKIGSTLAKRFALAGHIVTVANSRGPESIMTFAREVGVTAGTLEEAVAGKNVVIVSIPQKNIPALPPDLFTQSPLDQVIVDTGNYMPHRDPVIHEIENGLVESLWVQRVLGRPVIKAFNSIMAESLLYKSKPAGTLGRIALPVAGDSAASKKVVMELVDLAGFDPFDAGVLDQSWRQQPGMPAYCTDLTLEELPSALERANRACGPDIRDAFSKELLEGWSQHTPDDRIRIIRNYHN